MTFFTFGIAILPALRPAFIAKPRQLAQPAMKAVKGSTD